MPNDQMLFDNLKLCKRCKRQLPSTYEEDLCPICINQALFEDVKDYIRGNDVNEMDVAEHFHIPVATIKAWIKEGRIEYKDENLNKKLVNVFCQKCGKPIQFGTLCPECAHKAGMSVTAIGNAKGDASKMRFVDN